MVSFHSQRSSNARRNIEHPNEVVHQQVLHRQLPSATSFGTIEFVIRSVVAWFRIPSQACIISILCISIQSVISESSSSSSSAGGYYSNSYLPNYRQAVDEVDKVMCYRQNLDCPSLFGLYCCSNESGYIRCCDKTNIQPVYKNPSGGVHWLQRFSLWNMWYFWFIVVFIMAMCFTGCNYWRRQRRSHSIRLFQRQYTAIGGNGCRRSNEVSSGQQLVIPITMYEVSPDAILRLMRENAFARATRSTLLTTPRLYGRYYHQHHRHQHQQHPEDIQEPPSYCEVTSKPNKYPPKVDESEPPSYESVSQLQREASVRRGDNGSQGSVHQCCSSL